MTVTCSHSHMNSLEILQKRVGLHGRKKGALVQRSIASRLVSFAALTGSGISPDFKYLCILGWCCSIFRFLGIAKLHFHSTENLEDSWKSLMSQPERCHQISRNFLVFLIVDRKSLKRNDRWVWDWASLSRAYDITGVRDSSRCLGKRNKVTTTKKRQTKGRMARGAPHVGVCLAIFVNVQTEQSKRVGCKIRDSLIIEKSGRWQIVGLKTSE